MSDLNKEALDVWGALKPMIDQEINSRTQGMVQRRKAKVTTAPSLVTNTIGVTEAFGDEMFLPFVSNMISAKVGDFVWIEWMYGATNAFVSSFAAVDDKDYAVAGNLTVGGNTTLNGNATVGGNTALNGVLDVVPRRCYATLSSEGWYRVCAISFYSYGEAIGAAGGILRFAITDSYASYPNDAHTIDLLLAHNKVTFVNEASAANGYLEIDKIRYTFTGTSPYNGYVDIHFLGRGGTTYVGVSFDYAAISLARQANVVAQNLQSVVESPANETVLITHNFVSDNSPVGVTNSSNLLTSGTIASSGSMSYTATVPCWVYLMFIMQANSSGSINVQIDNVNIINWSSGEAVPVNISFLPIPLMTGNTLYVAQSSNRASTYSIFAMR